jgi:hypothetical protein
LIVQPRVAVHPALRGLALSALPTIRILTMKDEQGRPEVVGATLRFASNAEACVDNMKAGGLMSAVDLGSGRLGVACRGYGGPDHCRHPVNGEPVEGRLLPDWEAAKLLAMRAHADGFADYALVGWDVAPSPEGPVLIEGNGKPSVLLSQRAAHSGLAQGRYGKLLAHHLAKQSPY